MQTNVMEKGILFGTAVFFLFQKPNSHLYVKRMQKNNESNISGIQAQRFICNNRNRTWDFFADFIINEGLMRLTLYCGILWRWHPLVRNSS